MFIFGSRLLVFLRSTKHQLIWLPSKGLNGIEPRLSPATESRLMKGLVSIAARLISNYWTLYLKLTIDQWSSHQTWKLNPNLGQYWNFPDLYLGGGGGGVQLGGGEAGAVQGAVCTTAQVWVKHSSLTRTALGECPDIEAWGVRGQVSEDEGGARGVREQGEPPVHVLVVLVNVDEDSWRECLVFKRISWTAEID